MPEKTSSWEIPLLCLKEAYDAYCRAYDADYVFCIVLCWYASYANYYADCAYLYDDD